MSRLKIYLNQFKTCNIFILFFTITFRDEQLSNSTVTVMTFSVNGELYGVQTLPLSVIYIFMIHFLILEKKK